MKDDRRAGADQETPECARIVGALGEHSQQEGGEQGCIHEAEDQLQDSHDVVILSCDQRTAHGQDDARDGGQLAHV